MPGALRLACRSSPRRWFAKERLTPTSAAATISSPDRRSLDRRDRVAAISAVLTDSGCWMSSLRRADHALRSAAGHNVRSAGQDIEATRPAPSKEIRKHHEADRPNATPEPSPVTVIYVVLPKASRVVGKLRHPRRRLRLLARGAKHPQGAGRERQPTHHGKDRSRFFLEG